MADFEVTCCSTADLDVQTMSRLGVDYARFHFTLDGIPYSDDLGTSVPFSEFYGRLAAGSEATTAQVNISEYLDLFTPILRDGKDILHICLSTGLSGSYNSARNAALIAAEQFPGRRISVVDSLGASSGFGFLVEAAVEKKREGYTLEELTDWLQENRLRVNHWFFSTDLSFYVKGGRISRAAGFVGGVLGICPLLNMDAQGCLIPRYKIRSKRKVITEIVNKMEQYADGGLSYDGKCFISHSGCLEDARAVAELIEQRFPKLNGQVRIYDVGTVIGSHTGPGTVALYFWGRDRSLPMLNE